MNISKQKKDISDFKEAFSIHFLSVTVGIFLSIFLAAGTKFDLTVPTGFYDDRTALFMIIKSMLNGTFVSVDQISYPDTFSYLYFPVSDFTQRALIYLLSRLSQDVIVISNLYHFAHIALSFMASYAAAYSYSGRRALSCIAALLFIFTPYLVVRSVDHDFLAAFYAVPVTFYLAINISRYDEQIREREIHAFALNPLHLFLFFILALSGIYYTFFSIVLLLYSGLALSYLRATTAYIRLSLISIMMMVIILGIAMLPVIIYHHTHDIAVPSRHFMEQTLYGIRVADLIWTAQQYFSVPSFTSYFEARGISEGYDFWPGLGLSIFGLIIIFMSPFILLKHMHQGESSSELRKELELTAIFILFLALILFTAHVYGAGLIMNMIFNSIRSQSRLSPYFTFALILILLSGTKKIIASRQVKKEYPNQTLAVVHLTALVFFILNAFPFFGFMAHNQNALISRDAYIADRKSITATLDAIHGTKLRHVLQLPLASWPEHLTIEEFQPYHHLFFYIFDKPLSPIRWSYGMVRESKTLTLLQSIEMDPDRAARLKAYACYGYDTLLIEKRGLKSHELNLMQQGAGSLGVKLLFDDPLRSIFVLPHVTSEECQAYRKSASSS